VIDPHDDVPDGDTGAPHHAYIGWIVQVLGVAVAWFGFEYIWAYYGSAGAMVTLAGMALSGVGLLVALDDVVEHTWGLPTPLDELWGRWLAPYVRRLDRRR